MILRTYLNKNPDTYICLVWYFLFLFFLQINLLFADCCLLVLLVCMYLFIYLITSGDKMLRVRIMFSELMSSVQCSLLRRDQTSI